MTRVLRLTGIGPELAYRMSQPTGIAYAELIQRLGSPAAVYNFIAAVCGLVDNLTITVPATTGMRFNDNFPALFQGADGDEWDGQPVVYDGDFELRDGELWYTGMSTYHGQGVPVSRKVMYHDVIDWERCESLNYYIGEF